MLLFSSKVSQILVARPECFKQFVALAVFRVGGHFTKCQCFWDALEAKGLVTGQMVWGTCTRGVYQNLVFLGTEPDVCARLQAVQFLDKRKMPTPGTVLAKMVALRLRKLRDKIDEVNQDRAAHNAYLAQQNAAWVGPAPAPPSRQPR